MNTLPFTSSPNLRLVNLYIIATKVLGRTNAASFKYKTQRACKICFPSQYKSSSKKVKRATNTKLRLLRALVYTLTSSELVELEDHIQARKNHVCRLLNLPPELRNRIYDLVADGGHAEDRHVIRYSSLLATCQMLRTEFSGIYFNEQYWRIEVFKTGARKLCWTKITDMEMVKGLVLNILQPRTMRLVERGQFEILGCRGRLEITYANRPGGIHGFKDVRERAENLLRQSTCPRPKEVSLVGFLKTPLSCERRIVWLRA